MDLVDQLKVRVQGFRDLINGIRQSYVLEHRQDPVENSHYDHMTSNLMTSIETAPDMLDGRDISVDDVIPIVERDSKHLVAYLDKVQRDSAFALHELFTREGYKSREHPGKVTNSDAYLEPVGA